jgi:thiosulfate dehydrogenase
MHAHFAATVRRGIVVGRRRRLPITCASTSKKVGPLPSPNEADIVKGPMGDSIRYRAKLLKRTQIYAKDCVGNGLDCTSCDLNGGETAYASYGRHLARVSEYRSRNAEVNALLGPVLQRTPEKVV